MLSGLCCHRHLAVLTQKRFHSAVYSISLKLASSSRVTYLFLPFSTLLTPHQHRETGYTLHWKIDFLLNGQHLIAWGMKTKEKFLSRERIDCSVLLLCRSNHNYNMSIDNSNHHHHYHHHLQKITINMDTGRMVVGYQTSPIW